MQKIQLTDENIDAAAKQIVDAIIEKFGPDAFDRDDLEDQVYEYADTYQIEHFDIDDDTELRELCGIEIENHQMSGWGDHGRK